MPATLHIYIPLYIYCSLHIDPILLYTEVDNKLQLLFIMLPHANNKYMPQMPCMPISSCADITQLCQDIYFISTYHNQVSLQTLVYIHFTLLTYAPKKICLSHHTGMAHCPYNVVYMMTPTLLHIQAKKATNYNFVTMLKLYMCQQQICLSNATSIAHSEIILCISGVKYANIHTTYEVVSINNVSRIATYRWWWWWHRTRMTDTGQWWSWWHYSPITYIKLATWPNQSKNKMTNKCHL